MWQDRKYKDIAVISIIVVINGPLATAGSILKSFNVIGTITAIIGAISTVSHKDSPTTSAIVKGMSVKDLLIDVKINVIPKSCKPND